MRYNVYIKEKLTAQKLMDVSKSHLCDKVIDMEELQRK